VFFGIGRASGFRMLMLVLMEQG